MSPLSERRWSTRYLIKKLINLTRGKAVVDSLSREFSDEGQDVCYHPGRMFDQCKTPDRHKSVSQRSA